MAFPAYAEVPAERWHWFVEGCAAGRVDPGFALRARTYDALTRVWWAAVFARHSCEIEHGLAEGRLVQRPPGWRESVPRQYQRALERARQALQASAADSM